jgi:hypothetical protein
MERTSSATVSFSFLGTWPRCFERHAPGSVGLGVWNLLHKNGFQSGQTVHDPKLDLTAVESTPLQTFKKLAPAGSRFLISGLQAQNGSAPLFFGNSDGHQNRFFAHCAFYAHGKQGAVHVHVFDWLLGQVTFAPCFHGFGELCAAIADFGCRDRSSDEPLRQQRQRACADPSQEHAAQIFSQHIFVLLAARYNLGAKFAVTIPEDLDINLADAF